MAKPAKNSVSRVNVGSGRSKKPSSASLFSKMNKWVAVAIIVAFGGVGSYLMFTSHAASLPYYVEYGGTSLGYKHYAPGKFTLVYGSEKLAFQGDGNLVLYGGARPWASNTNGKLCANGFLTLRDNGDVAIYNGCGGGNGVAIWHAGVVGVGFAYYSLSLHRVDSASCAGSFYVYGHARVTSRLFDALYVPTGYGHC